MYAAFYFIENAKFCLFSPSSANPASLGTPQIITVLFKPGLRNEFPLLLSARDGV
jgi:hypothetical protein